MPAKAWTVLAVIGVSAYAQHRHPESGRALDARTALALPAAEDLGSPRQVERDERTPPDPSVERVVPDTSESTDIEEADISDEQIRTTIEAMLSASGLAVDDLEVRVASGVVSVYGTAKSLRVKEDVWRLIWHVPGVADIVNGIELKARFSVMPIED